MTAETAGPSSATAAALDSVRNRPSSSSSVSAAATASQRKKAIGNYVLGKTIGEGTFGKVKLATHLLTGEKVAVKILEKDRIVDVADVERVSREIHILKMINHPNIIRLYEVIDTPKHIYLIMEYATGGELFDYIVAHSRVKEKEARRFFHQIVCGVDYCHKMNVIHRDLKPENLLLDVSRTIKIVDFGLSNMIKPGHLLKTACGSPCYAAPEMIAGKQYVGSSADIWSMGVILFALICGYLPFEDSNTAALYKKILNGDYTAPNFISPEAKDLIRRMLTVNPEKRFTVDDIRRHPWYTAIPDTTPRVTPSIRIDADIVKQLEQFGFNSKYAQKCLQENKHNHVTATYWLLFERKAKEAARLGLPGSGDGDGSAPAAPAAPTAAPPYPAFQPRFQQQRAQQAAAAAAAQAAAAQRDRRDVQPHSPPSPTSPPGAFAPTPPAASKTSSAPSVPPPPKPTNAFGSGDAIAATGAAARAATTSNSAGAVVQTAPARWGEAAGSAGAKKARRESSEASDDESLASVSTPSPHASGDAVATISAVLPPNYAGAAPPATPAYAYYGGAPTPSPALDSADGLRPTAPPYRPATSNGGPRPPPGRGAPAPAVPTLANPPFRRPGTVAAAEAASSLDGPLQPQPPSVPLQPQPPAGPSGNAANPRRRIIDPTTRQVVAGAPAPAAAAAVPAGVYGSRPSTAADASSGGYAIQGLVTYRAMETPRAPSAGPVRASGGWTGASAAAPAAPAAAAAASGSSSVRRPQVVPVGAAINMRSQTPQAYQRPAVSPFAAPQPQPWAAPSGAAPSSQRVATAGVTPLRIRKVSGASDAAANIAGFVTARRVGTAGTAAGENQAPGPNGFATERGQESPIKRHAGALNVSSTSSKPPKEIMDEMRRILEQNRIPFKQISEFCLKCEKQPRIRFEMEVTKLDNLDSMYVVRMKRITGDTWAYKDLCSRLQAQLKL